MLIVIKIIARAKTEQEHNEFIKSLSYSHSGTVPYQVSNGEDVYEDGDIFITLPDDCLVLGNAWDRYIQYAIDNGLPKHGLGNNYVPNWNDYVQKKMGLQTRRAPEGLFPDLKVVVATE